MKFDLNLATRIILKNPQFKKLKNVVENNPWHDHEDAYSHSLKTAKIAKKEIKARFITNRQAKNLYISFINDGVFGIQRKDIMILIALLHNIGKILVIDEHGTKKPICIVTPDKLTTCPGHEYWGSKIVGTIVKDLDITPDHIAYIATVINMHDTFSDSYLLRRKNWPIELLINDIKSRAQGRYIEALFNIYCANFNAEVSKETRTIIRKLFNKPSLYTSRSYKIP